MAEKTTRTTVRPRKRGFVEDVVAFTVLSATTVIIVVSTAVMSTEWPGVKQALFGA